MVWRKAIAFWRPLRRRLLLVFLLGIVIPTLGAVWLFQERAKELLLERSLQQEDKVLLEISRTLWDLQDQSQKRLLLLATQPGLAAHLESGQAPPDEILLTFLRLNPQWVDLQLFNARGRQIWRLSGGTAGECFEPFFLTIFNMGEAQTPVFIREGQPLMRFGASLQNEKRFAGVVIASVELSSIERMLRQLRYSSGTQSLIWDDRGMVFGSSLSEEEQQGLGAVLDLAALGREVFETGGAVLHRELQLGEQRLLLSARSVPELIDRLDPIPGQNWFVGSLTPLSLTFSELQAFRQRTFGFLALLFLMLGGALFWTARRVTGPLEQMAAFSAKVSKGERKVQLELSGAPEVTALAESLNEMTRSLARYEAELIHSEIMATLGKMSSVAAHELRNPLNAIKVTIQYLQMKRPDDPVIAESADIILRKIRSLTRFADSLLKLGRLPPPQLQQVELKDLLEGTVVPLREKAACEIRIDPNCREVGTLECDPDQLTELVENLVQNSLDALPAGGVVEIRARRNLAGVEMEFRDSGPGPAPEIRERLFKPFATTRKWGTGLGLFLCRMVAENHQGSIHYQPAEEGSCFVVRLPAA